MLKALVIVPNDKTTDMGDILQIARALAQKREHNHKNVNVRSILFDPITSTFVAIYEPPTCSREAGVSPRRKENEK